MRKGCLLAAIMFAAPVSFLCGAENAEVRSIKLVQDDAQVEFVSKLYDLKHVKAVDVLPFVSSAILRYHANSKIERVTYGDGGHEALLVSTGRALIPFVDKLIAEIDSEKSSRAVDGSSIEGTGVTRIAYEPKYRAAKQFERILDQLVSSSEGRAYVNDENNTIYWQDADSAARETLHWVDPASAERLFPEFFRTELKNPVGYVKFIATDER